MYIYHMSTLLLPPTIHFTKRSFICLSVCLLAVCQKLVTNFGEEFFAGVCVRLARTDQILASIRFSLRYSYGNSCLAEV